MVKKKLDFEEALKGLEDAVNQLKSEDISLDEALLHFEEGMKHYKLCKEQLDQAQERIKLFDKIKQELSDFDE